MENAGCVTFAENFIFPGYKGANWETAEWVNVIIHELVHQWYGNLVTNEWWGDVFLHEAFATYTSYVV